MFGEFVLLTKERHFFIGLRKRNLISSFCKKRTVLQELKIFGSHSGGAIFSSVIYFLRYFGDILAIFSSVMARSTVGELLMRNLIMKLRYTKKTSTEDL